MDAEARRCGSRPAEGCDGLHSAAAPKGAGGESAKDDGAAGCHDRSQDPDDRDSAGQSAGGLCARLQSDRRLWRLALSRLSALLLSAQPALLPGSGLLLRHGLCCWRRCRRIALGLGQLQLGLRQRQRQCQPLQQHQPQQHPGGPGYDLACQFQSLAPRPRASRRRRLSRRRHAAAISRPAWHALHQFAGFSRLFRRSGGTALGQGAGVSRGQGSLGQGSLGQGSRGQGSLRGGANAGQRAGAGSANRGRQYNAFGDFGSRGSTINRQAGRGAGSRQGSIQRFGGGARGGRGR